MPRPREIRSFSALPPSAARLNNHPFLENVWFFRFGTPGLQQKQIAKAGTQGPFHVLTLMLRNSASGPEIGLPGRKPYFRRGSTSA